MFYSTKNHGSELMIHQLTEVSVSLSNLSKYASFVDKNHLIDVDVDLTKTHQVLMQITTQVDGQVVWAESVFGGDKTDS